jgi:signal transduction histidine kinase
MARGLAPALIDSDGLGGALRELAAGAEGLHRVRCRYVGPDLVRTRDPVAALHLYRIAQEAIRGAALHDGAREVELLLQPRGEHFAMTIRDDGHGPTAPEAALDLRTMRYRAGIVGATLEVRPGADGGTEAECVFPHGG